MTFQDFVAEYNLFDGDGDDDSVEVAYDTGLQWCGYVLFDREFLDVELQDTSWDIAVDQFGYEPGPGASEPEDYEYFRKEVFPKLSDQAIVDIGRFLIQLLDVITENK